jgi:hypothetical protein
MPEIKIFTLDEAERSLPLVRRILADLQAEYGTWREAVATFEGASAAPKAEEGSEELEGLRARVTAAALRINGYLEELESIGCLFKGFEEGLVDFYALKDDRLVFLCWKLGEEHITHWHEVDTGFAGRRPIEAGAFSGIVP